MGQTISLTPPDPAAAVARLRQAVEICRSELAAVEGALAAIETTVVRPVTASTLLTVDEVAAELWVSRNRVFALIRAGELDSIMVGKRRCVPRSTLDAFISLRMAS